MHKLLRVLLGTLAVLGLLTLDLPAQASYTGTVPDTYSDSNCDQGNPVKNCKSNYALIQFLNAVPCPTKGQTPAQIHASVYSVTIEEVYLAYKRPIDCGVAVDIVWAKQIDEDGGKVGNSQWMDKLVKLKGIHTKIKEVTASGMASGKRGTQHIKVVTRSTDNGVFSSSNNTSYSGDRDAWGGWYQFSDKKIYDYSNGMIMASMKDKSQSACKYSGKGTDIRRAVYYQPCSFDPILDILKHSHAGKGCTWYWQMFMVTSYADPKVKEIERLGREGCKMYVLVNYGGTWTDSYIRELSGAKNVQVNDASYNPKHPNDKVYNHGKRNAAKGVLFNGKPYSFISDGSATDTSEGYKYSANNLIISSVPEEAQAGLNWATYAQDASRVLTHEVLCPKGSKKSGC